MINEIKAYETKNGIFDKEMYDTKMHQIIALFFKNIKELSDD
ncbi:hypothetical protein [Campylobacter sp. RM16190]|nr:hypothetical protein [Campylobacter sp. RM16190]